MELYNLLEEFSLKNYKSNEIPVEDLKKITKLFRKRLEEIFTPNFMVELKKYMKNKIKIGVEDDESKDRGWVYSTPSVMKKDHTKSEFMHYKGFKVPRAEFQFLNYMFINRKYLHEKWFNKKGVSEFINTIVHEFLHLANFRYTIKRMNDFINKFKTYKQIIPISIKDTETYSKRKEIISTMVTVGYEVYTIKSREEVLRELSAINVFKREFLEKQIKVKYFEDDKDKVQIKGRAAKKMNKSDENDPGESLRRISRRKKSLGSKKLSREDNDPERNQRTSDAINRAVYGPNWNRPLKTITPEERAEQKIRKEEQKAREEKSKKRKENRIRNKRRRAEKP